MKVLCLLLQHKWTPAEETNEAPLQLVCARCGRTQSFGDETYEQPGAPEKEALRFRFRTAGRWQS